MTDTCRVKCPNMIMPLPFKPRILVLPFAALVIVALVIYKTNQPVREISLEDQKARLARRPAPTFKLHDLASQPLSLGRYLGRHKLLMVFFDPTGGVAQNEQLKILKSGYSRLTAHGEKVIAISNATPYANRESVKRAPDYRPDLEKEVDYFPFHVLSDADYSVGTQWGCMNAGDPPRVVPSAFVIDRAGVFNWSQIGGPSPIPLETLLSQVRQAR